MKSKIEEFIESRANMLDVGIPDDEKVWKGISGELQKTRKRRVALLRAAAIIILAVSSGLTVYLLGFKSKNGLNEYSLNNVSAQLGKEENFFRLTVNGKLNEVRKSGVNHEDFSELMRNLEQIDHQYEIYVKDLQEIGNQPRILKGIIRLYELKIRVIEKALNEIEKNKKYEKDKQIL